MKRSIIAVAAALALPAAALADKPTPSPKESAAQACKAERASTGAETFRATYGTGKNGKNAMGKCVSKREKDEKAAREQKRADRKAAKKAAVKACKAERKADPAAFRAKYGKNKNKKNAFGKCVSKAVK